MRLAETITTHLAFAATCSSLLGACALLGGVVSSAPWYSPLWWLALAAGQLVPLGALWWSRSRTDPDDHQDLAEAPTHHQAMLSNMSHQVFTPMNAILGLSEQLLIEDLEPEVRRSLEQVHGSGQEMVRHLETILDYCALESGLLELEHKSFYLDALMAELHTSLHAAAQAKGLALHVEQLVAPHCVIGDRRRLHRLLDELVRNAIMVSDSGTIHVEVVLPSHGPLTIVVRDEGPGFSDAEIEAMFRPFSVHAPSSLRAPQGLGLGLTIARQIAELMGGELRAEATPGRGAAFTLKLYLPRGESSRPAIRVPTADCEATLRALIVEDNAVNRHIASRLLTQLGLDVDIVENGQLAVAHLAQRQVDLVLMDLHMPVMDGAEAAAAIRRDLSRPQPRIVAMTASALSHDRRRCFDVGMDEVLHKPLSRQKLEAMLGSLFPQVELDRERIRELK